MPSITNNSIKHQSFTYTQLNDQIVLFQANSAYHKYIVQMSNSSIKLIDRNLTGATTLGQSGQRSDINEGVLHIPPNFSITEASPSDGLVSYAGHLLEEFYSPAEM